MLQRLAEVRSERTTPIYFLRRALEAILMDTSTIYASLQIISEAQDLAVMLVTAGETPSEAFLEVNRAQWLLSGGETGYAASKVCKRLEAALKTTKSSPPPGTSSSSSSPFTPPSDSLNDSTYIDPKALMIGCSREKEKALASSSFASTSSSSQIGSIFSAKPLASVASQATGNQIKEARKKVPVDWQQLVSPPSPPLSPFTLPVTSQP